MTVRKMHGGPDVSVGHRPDVTSEDLPTGRLARPVGYVNLVQAAALPSVLRYARIPRFESPAEYLERVLRDLKAGRAENFGSAGCSEDFREILNSPSQVEFALRLAELLPYRLRNRDWLPIWEKPNARSARRDATEKLDELQGKVDFKARTLGNRNQQEGARLTSVFAIPGDQSAI